MKIISCLLFFLVHSSMLASPTYIKLIDGITSKFTKELRNEKKLFLTGYGGRMMDDIKEVDLSFDCVKHVSLTEARSLFVEIAERYLILINNDTKLRPYLHNYPFTIDNLELNIAFNDEKNQWHTHGEITYVMYSSKRGNLIYSTYDPTKESLEHIYEEPYAEAVKLVQARED